MDLQNNTVGLFNTSYEPWDSKCTVSVTSFPSPDFVECLNYCEWVLTLGHLFQRLTMEPRTSVTSFRDIPIPRCSRSSISVPYGSFVNSLTSLAPDVEEKPAVSPKRAYVTMVVLCYINLLNYMERYTIAGWVIFLCRQHCVSIHIIYCLQLCWTYTLWFFLPCTGVLADIKKFFDIRDSTAGLLQTGMRKHLFDTETLLETKTLYNLSSICLICRRTKM